jgi:death-on-curing protein
MPTYLSADEVKAINRRILGVDVLRGEPGLLSALARPLTVAYYQQADLALQAAVLIEGLCQAHPFVDANKRTATAAGHIFLRLNGYRLQYVVHPMHDELGQQIIALVLHQTSTEVFAQWLRSHLEAMP